MRRRVLFGGLVAVMILGLFPAAAVAGGAVRGVGDLTPTDDPVYDTLGFGDVQGDGTASIVRTRNGISVTVNATGLNPGNAYSMWYIVIENGDEIVVHAAGSVVGGSGNASFASHLSTGPIGAVNGTTILVNDGDKSFDDPLGALVILHVVDHGSAGVDGPGTIPENIREFTGADGLAQEYVF